MLVSDLLAALNDVSLDAEVQLHCCRKPDSSSQSNEASGDVIYVAISNIDGHDRLVILSNYVTNKRNEPVFNAPPQFKRFCISSKSGPTAAIADLQEQANCEPTQDLHDHLEVKRIKSVFDSFNSLLRQNQQPSAPTPDDDTQ